MIGTTKFDLRWMTLTFIQAHNYVRNLIPLSIAWTLAEGHKVSETETPPGSFTRTLFS